MAEAKREATETEKAAAAQILQELMKGGANPTAHNATAPADQKVIAFFDANNQLNFADNPNYKEEAPKSTVYGGADTGYFVLDKNGQPQVVANPNPDTLVSAAVDRQGKEALRNERQANADAGKGYVTAKELADMQNDARQRNVSEGELKQRIAEFGVTQKAADARDAANKAKIEQDIKESAARVGQIGATTVKLGAETALTNAQTTQAGASTEATQATTDIAKRKAGPEIAEIEARTAQAKALQAKAELEMKKPSVLTGLEGPTIAKMGPNGEVTEEFRQGYVPKTLGEVQARVGQIHAAANAKAAQLQGKIGEGYTPEQADKEFRAWYDQNVSPYTASLQAAQEEALYARQKDQAASQVSAYTAAQAAGRNTVDAWQAQAPYRVGPNAAAAAAQAAKTGNVGDLSGAAFYDMPDLNQMQQKAVADALKAISPTAAAQAGAPMPNYQGVDIANTLNATQWNPGGGAPLPPPPAQPAPQPQQQGAVTVTVNTPQQTQPQPAPQPAMMAQPDWARADQMYGAAPAGNAMAAPGVAGVVSPDSPVYMGGIPTPPRRRKPVAVPVEDEFAPYQFPA